MSGLGLLGRLKLRLLVNQFRTFREHSKFKIAVVTFFGLFFWFGLFFLFYGGFRFIKVHVDDLLFRSLIQNYLLALYFFSLFLMLAFSTGLIVQASLFRARETEFLLVTPLSESSVFAYKFVESLSFSSWVVLLLGTPVVLAYGLYLDAPWTFYVALPPLFLLFLTIPAALGTLVVLLVASFLLKHRRKVVVLLLGGLVVGLVYLGLEISGVSRERDTGVFTNIWVLGVFDKIRFVQHPLSPTYWMKELVVRLASGRTDGVLFYSALLLANALFAYSLGERVAAWRFRHAYSIAASLGGGKPIARSFRLSAALSAVFFFLPARTRLYLEKDIKSFVRDPVQCAQFLILVGLLFLYIVNLRTLSYDERNAFWRNLIAFLNLGATSLTMTTFASRFVFPLLSLEGKRFWILGMLPIERRSILTGKFVYAFTTTVVVSEALIVLSCTMLRVPLAMTLLHAYTVAVICVGVSGLAVGLGALYPNFRVDDPSKIVSGFGGTLNLVLSLAFILAVILVEAIPCHIFLTKAETKGQDPFGAGYGAWILAPAAVGLAISGLACWIPMRLGARHFQRLEF